MACGNSSSWVSWIGLSRTSSLEQQLQMKQLSWCPGCKPVLTTSARSLLTDWALSFGGWKRNRAASQTTRQDTSVPKKHCSLQPMDTGTLNQTGPGSLGLHLRHPPQRAGPRAAFPEDPESIRCHVSLADFVPGARGGTRV